MQNLPSYVIGSTSELKVSKPEGEQARDFEAIL